MLAAGCLITLMGSSWATVSLKAGVGPHGSGLDSGYHLIQGQLLIQLLYTSPALINELI